MRLRFLRLFLNHRHNLMRRGEDGQRHEAAMTWAMATEVPCLGLVISPSSPLPLFFLPLLFLPFCFFVQIPLSRFFFRSVSVSVLMSLLLTQALCLL